MIYNTYPYPHIKVVYNDNMNRLYTITLKNYSQNN